MSSNSKIVCDSLAAMSFALVVLSTTANAQWGIVGLGGQRFDTRSNDERFVGTAAGEAQSFGRRSDGSVIAWGFNGYSQYNVPTLPTGLVYVGIAAGWLHDIAWRRDGSGVAWGSNTFGECNIPSLQIGV